MVAHHRSARASRTGPCRNGFSRSMSSARKTPRRGYYRGLQRWRRLRTVRSSWKRQSNGPPGCVPPACSQTGQRGTTGRNSRSARRRHRAARVRRPSQCRMHGTISVRANRVLPLSSRVPAAKARNVNRIGIRGVGERDRRVCPNPASPDNEGRREEASLGSSKTAGHLGKPEVPAVALERL